MEKLSNIDDQFDKIVDLIKTSDNYQKYLEIKNELDHNEKVKNLVNDIKRLQKLAVNKEYNNIDISDINKEIDDIYNKLNDIPLYIEYNRYLKILDDEQILIKNKINSYIDSII